TATELTFGAMIKSHLTHGGRGLPCRRWHHRTAVRASPTKSAASGPLHSRTDRAGGDNRPRDSAHSWYFTPSCDERASGCQVRFGETVASVWRETKEKEQAMWLAPSSADRSGYCCETGPATAARPCRARRRSPAPALR